MAMDLDRRAFIRAHTRLRPVARVPEINLHVADDATDLWQQTEAELDAIGLPPPFWAFAWAGGQALARYLLDHPRTVAGRSVLDIASGSGLVAIAAARCGALAVTANDVDAFALDAIELNAEANGVAVNRRGGDLVGLDGDWDVVLAADIFYERDTAARMTGWLDALYRRGAKVLVGDPGRSYFERGRFDAVASYDVPVSRALEDVEIMRSTVWRLR